MSEMIDQEKLHQRHIPDGYRVERTPFRIVRPFIIQHHYSHGCHNGPTTYALYDEDVMVGACAFSTPCSENVRGSVFGPGHVDRVTELSRLVLLDECPPNSESWFVSRCLKLLKGDKPHLWAVISFADSTEGHDGTIYRALNFRYCGMTSTSKMFYRDETGRIRHPRQDGVNISRRMAEEMGWEVCRRGPKHRYVFFLGSPRQRRRLESICLLQQLPFDVAGESWASD